MKLLALFLTLLQLNVAFADTFPMNGKYVVRGSTVIGLLCRGLGTNQRDSLGQTNVTITAVSDSSGLYLYNDAHELIASFLEADGYQYFDKNQTLAKGRSLILVNGKSLIFAAKIRLPSDVGFGTNGCEFPKAKE